MIITPDTSLEDGTKIIKANKHCDDIVDFLKPISFKLQNTLITIQPRGYTYMMAENQGYCSIGIQMLKGE